MEKYKNDVLKLIRKNCKAEDICKKLHIDLRTLSLVVDLLKADGIDLYPKFNAVGELFFGLKKINQDSDVMFTTDENEYSFLVISDIHIGSMFDAPERLKVIRDFANYCDINLILNCGDLVDGPFHEDQSLPRRINNLEDQLVELLEVYPQENGLNTVCVLGDHDLKYKTEYGDCVNKTLKKYRPDIKVYSSGSGNIKINGKDILICHDSSDNRIKQRLLDDMFMFAGHSHMYINKAYFNGIDYSLRITAPSVSDLPKYNKVMPGLLKVTMFFQDYDLSKVNIENYNFDSDDKLLFNGVTTYNFNMNRQFVRGRKK